MDILQKAKILAEAGHYDSCGPKACEIKVESGLGGIYTAKIQNDTCRIFKTLMTNTCTLDCKYCQNSIKCNNRKVEYTPQELSRLYLHLHKTLAVEGLFLSSGINKSADHTTEKMLETVKLVRKQFKGYIHFKVLPGTSRHLVKEASRYVNRMSINIEAPNKSILNEYSNCKDFKIDILRRQAWIKVYNPNQATQMIVHHDTTDKELIKMAHWEYNTMHLRRVYYSAFKPVHNTPLEKQPATPLHRQNRLYNTDFLIKDYNLKPKDLEPILNDNGMLPREDPKLALAKATIDKPIDINDTNMQELMRIPGIGLKTAKRITESKTKFKTYRQLHALGAHTKKARPFININGKKQTRLTAFT